MTKVGKPLNSSGLKYLDGFTNPYVKIILVCKLCNKEQASKCTSNWKAHYLTHTAEKRHKCELCAKTFVQTNHLKAHMSKHLKEQNVKNGSIGIKLEQKPNQYL